MKPVATENQVKIRIEYPGYFGSDRTKTRAERIVFWGAVGLIVGPIVGDMVLYYFGMLNSLTKSRYAIFEPLLFVGWPTIISYLSWVLLKRIAGVPVLVANPNSKEGKRKRIIQRINLIGWLCTFATLCLFLLFIKPQLEALPLGGAASVAAVMIVCLACVSFGVAVERLLLSRFARQ